MLDNNLTEEAIALARSTISLLDEKEYIAFERKGFERDMEYARKNFPAQYKPKPFPEAEERERFRGTEASYYTLLGRAYLKQDKLEDAEEAYRKAYAIERDAPAAVGIATILEKRGNDKEALEYMTQADLTGRLDKDGIAQFQNLYRRTHDGKLDGIEEYLDAQYRPTYHNPVRGEKYKPTGAHTDRIVLAEFFTGAGCIPCLAFDYTFETALEDYSRSELALLVYDWHAPTMDPLGNRSSDARVKYYDVNGAPTVFIDGKKFITEDDDARSKGEAEKAAQRVYTAITSNIRADLAIPAEGQIKLDAKRVGTNIHVGVIAAHLKNSSPDVTLQLALVEDEVHYSGENGLRFHLMVVRNLARQAGAESYGFKVDPSRSNKFEYVFDINDIMAQNLRYYDEYTAEKRKEFAARVGPDADDYGIDFSFKEHRNIINPDDLSVVAFLQDNKTKRILQSAYLRLAPDGNRNNVARSK